jgi:hypothetical protein
MHLLFGWKTRTGVRNEKKMGMGDGVDWTGLGRIGSDLIRPPVGVT